MRVLLLLSFGLGLLPGSEALADSAGYLYAPSFDMNAAPCGPAVPYCPQPGDIFLSSNTHLAFKLTYAIACTGPPHHCGIVIALPDGSMGVLEAGPGDTIRVAITDPVADFLQHTDEGGHVWVRRRGLPLTLEQSHCLTEFAAQVDGKPFAVVRMVTQMTPIRCRGPLRTRWLGQPHGSRRCSYFCSELVIEACVAAGLMDAADVRPAATYPRDLFFGRSSNPFLDAHLNINDGWLPPAQWSLFCDQYSVINDQ
jgi:hypothetical protein